MNIQKDLFEKYNTSSALFILTSFPMRGGEVASENAVARYSSLLVQNFPESQKIIVICEKRNEKDTPYELAENILVVPTYTVNSPKFAFEILRTMRTFYEVKNLLVQFEFSIFGGKIVLPGIISLLALSKLMGIRSTFMFHQVIRDLGKLSGHLGIGRKSLYRNVLNTFLTLFYGQVGLLSNKIIVHDSLLKKALSSVISPKKIFVIPHGCGNAEYLSPELRAEYRARLGIKKNELIILAYGYLSWYKGTDWIIKTVGRLSRKHPELHLKLLLPGVQSPTLKGTKAYELYKRRLFRLLKKYDKYVIQPGFIPESDVAGVFAASDIAVFPYRAKMSASGALSLAWQYGKRVLVSTEFSKNYDEHDAKAILQRYDVSAMQITFPLNTYAFEQTLSELIHRPGAGYNVARASRSLAHLRSWKNVAVAYRDVCFNNEESLSLAMEHIVYDA